MLLNNFFYIISTNPVDSHQGKYMIEVELNEKHPIYEGHFPGMPVTPGVCLVQMVKEIAGMILGKKLMMSRADNIKFVSVVNPSVNKLLFFELTLKPVEKEQWLCDCITFFEKTVFFKLKAFYKVSDLPD